uniref:NADH dehydrogenase subunit 4L n=1 Tax=Megalophaedusa aurantiaca TaxID=1885859 RepID=A0A224A1J0_9EUPU|nr:NADH dehydrogenase subunit 4L [Megalophaedusa aurantiaca]
MIYLSGLAMLLVFFSYIIFSTKKYILSSLLVLEAFVLLSLILSISFMDLSGYSLSFFILLLTFGVCEAGLGLSLLLSYIKASGNDVISSSINSAI